MTVGGRVMLNLAHAQTKTFLVLLMFNDNNIYTVALVSVLEAELL